MGVCAWTGPTGHLASHSISRMIRILLQKSRSLGEVMREKGVPEGFLHVLKGDPGRKYQLSNAVAYEPLTNYLDVSIKAFPSSSEPPAPVWGAVPLLSWLQEALQRVARLPPHSQVKGLRWAWAGALLSLQPGSEGWVMLGTKARGSTSYPELTSLLRRSLMVIGQI